LANLSFYADKATKNEMKRRVYLASQMMLDWQLRVAPVHAMKRVVK